MLILADAYMPIVVATLLVILLIAFATEVRTPEVSAITAAAFLLLAGIISVDDLLKAVGNPAPITIIGMFIISASLVRTGLLDSLAKIVTERARSHPRSAVGMLLTLIAVLSAFTNNTPLVMMMVPVGILLAKQLGEAPSKILMPISFAAILGGTCSLIGTSTNLLVDGVATEAGLRPFTLFEIAPVGVVVAIAGVAYLVLARSFLPSRDTIASTLTGTDTKRFTVSIQIEDRSPFIGQIATQVASFSRGDRRLIDLIRDDHSLRDRLSEITLTAGDVVVIRCSAGEVMTLQGTANVQLSARQGEPEVTAKSSRNSTVIEALVLPDAQVNGHRLRELAFRRRYGVHPIALHRRGSNLQERFENVVLEPGDTILLEGAQPDLNRMAEAENLLNLAAPAPRGYRRGKAPIALAVLLGVVLGASFDILPLPALVAIGVAVVLVSRCIEAEEAFSSVDWRIIALIVAMLAIGTSLEKAGLVETVVGFMTPSLGGLAPWVALAAIYLVSLLLTELVTNNAVAVVVTPVAIQLALALGTDPRPFVVAVMFAASASFLTPIGYQTNTLVYGAGGYRFADFAKFGLPLTVVVALTTLIAIPIIWPL